MNQTGDIHGAQVGTLKKAPATVRATNPLNPEYQIPGNQELATTQNDPYGNFNQQNKTNAQSMNNYNQ